MDFKAMLHISDWVGVKEDNVLFNDALYISDIWLRTTQTVREETRCGTSGLLSFIYHAH